MQAAGDLVAAALELATRVQSGHDHFQSWPLFSRVYVYGNASTIIADRNGAVGHDDHFNAITLTGERLIYAVVNRFEQDVVQSELAGGAYVHRGASPYAFESLEYLDLFCVVGVLGLRHLLSVLLNWDCHFDIAPVPSHKMLEHGGR